MYPRIKLFYVLSIITIVFLYPFSNLGKKLYVNYSAYLTLDELTSDSSEDQSSHPNIQMFLPVDCRINWLQSLLVPSLTEKENAWLRAIMCSPDYINLVRKFNPNNYKLARYATQLQPNSSESWFWLGDLVTDINPEIAAYHYRKGLSIHPNSSRIWVKLGTLIRDQDPEGAIQAYLEACYRGDPGKHGCYGAGSVAEKIGDTDRAIHYYRLSTWIESLNRANYLENRGNE